MNSSFSSACVLAALFGATLLSGTAQAAALELNCEDLRPDPKIEASMIAQLAQGVVIRKKKQLTVKTAARAIVMTDIGSGDDLEDVAYRFCDRKEGFILVNVFDGGDFNASLIEEATGKVRPAGAPVSFNQDRSVYVAATHNNGMDGDIWTLHGPRAVLWSGVAGFDSKDGESILAEFTRPAFDASGKLTAQAHCYRDPTQRWPVKLEQKGGKWAWTPFKKCKG